MTNSEEKSFAFEKDYFIASHEEGELIMKPFCACGNYLDEKYFCTDCSKQCMCTHVFCTNEDVLDQVSGFIKNSPSFRHFKAVLLPEK